MSEDANSETCWQEEERNDNGQRSTGCVLKKSAMKGLQVANEFKYIEKCKYAKDLTSND